MRSRDVVKMGIAFVSRTVRMTEECRGIAETLSTRLRMRGLWFFQVKKDGRGRLKLLEVSTRVASTMGLYRQLGVNFAQLSAYDALGIDVSVLKLPLEAELSRSLKNSYRLNMDYDVVYMDYDDTLTCRGKVNPLAMRFVYQCAVEGKVLILLTRHEGELLEDMKRRKLSLGLFDKIIHIGPGDGKADYIEHNNAILVDNLFVERKAVHDKLGIPVFDVDALEALLRWD
jgi:hypothetical protein